MIVSSDGSTLRVVTQPDHARLSAEILSLWRADDLPTHPRRADLLFAVREHDNGWRETDSAPRAHPETGRPYTFLDLPSAARLELWDRSTRRYAATRPAAAPLITLHALRLHQDRASGEPWREFLDQLEERLADQMDAAGLDTDTLEADYRWLALADGISLRACGALGNRFRASGIEVRRSGSELELDPFPLAGATTFSVPCRYIPDRRYAGDTDLAVELASAHWTEFKIRLVPR